MVCMVGYAARTNPSRSSGGAVWLRCGGAAVMATFEKPKPSDRLPNDLLPVIYESGVLNERLFDDLRNKVLNGEYPDEPIALAERLVDEKVLTDYQARRFLSNKSHGLIVGRYI